MSTEGDPNDGPGGAGRADEDPDAGDPPDFEDLLDHLEDLEDVVDTRTEQRRVREAIRVARRVPTGGSFGRVITGFDRADLAEAFVGSVVFGIPMLIEGGTLEVGDHIVTAGVLRVAGVSIPLFLLATALFGIGLVVGILYVAEFQDVRVQRAYLGVVPRRMVGVLGVAAVTSVALMTVWGRVDWGEPALAVGRITVCFVGMSLGAALGDILPGS